MSTGSKSLDDKRSTDELLTDFLNVFWLRPETALWRTIDLLALDSLGPDARAFPSPSLDLGCGDGVFSFVRAGGQFGLAFDAFQSLGGLDRYFQNDDVYNHFESDRVNPVVRRPPEQRIDFALDHKPALLKKAATLGLYRKLVCHDANQPLPFEDGSIRSVFSNILYWLAEPQAALNELSRVMMTDGHAVLMLPNSTFREYSFYYRLAVKTGDNAWKWLEKIDRGRFSDNVKHALTDAEWRDLFARSGLEVAGHVQHLSKTVVEAWDIGLRPIFPLLQKMISKLEEKDRLEVKEEWVNLFAELLLPLCSISWCTDSEHPPAFHCYHLRKAAPR